MVDFGERRPMSGEMRAFLTEACGNDEDAHIDALAVAQAEQDEAAFQLGAARIHISGRDEPGFDVPIRKS